MMQNEPVWGITNSNGKSFKVPKTTDMLTSSFGNYLFKPSSSSSNSTSSNSSSNIFDLFTFFSLACHSFIYLYLSKHAFLYLFIFWRLAYNLGLGILLYLQSTKSLLVNQFRNLLFLAPKYPKLYSFFVHQLERKLGPADNYQFDKVPIEFNTWLVFRSLVDLILVHDFFTYCLFIVSYWDASISTVMDIFRLLGGLLMVMFNLWVKLDAHRVVKDFAWYWGDFFFLLKNPSLTFDGVFELAPHPMYSVGYVGYYGAALMTGSYTILYVSLAAHAGQLVFLTLVENPHIFKTYGKDMSLSQRFLSNQKYGQVFKSYFTRDLIGLNKNLDMFRSTDLFTILVTVYAVLASLFGSILFTTLQAVFWMSVHTCMIGFLLYKQSTGKSWTRHFIRLGATKKDAFSHWKQIYNLSMLMMYISFVMAGFKLYSVPGDWMLGNVLLRHTIAVLLILLNIWTSMSVFDVLGDFGYFFGDFFIDQTELPIELFYTGIYRFVNNPEKLMGRAAIIGIAIGSGSMTMLIIAICSYLANMVFIKFVEEPHMMRLYGTKVRKESGIVKVVKAHVSPVVDKVVPKRVQLATTVRSWQSSSPEVGSKGQLSILEQISIKVITETKQVQMATKTLFDSHQTKYYEHLLTQQTKVDPMFYRLDVCKQVYTLGQPMEFKYTGPPEYECEGPVRDWIGIYPIEDQSILPPPVPPTPESPSLTKSVLLFVTTVSSHGHWKYLDPTQSITMDQQQRVGTCMFTNEQLPYIPGWYEARYHLNDTRAVVAVSSPFEMRLDMDMCTITKSMTTTTNVCDLAYLIAHIPHTGSTGMALDLDTIFTDQAYFVLSDRLLQLIAHLYQVEFDRLAFVQFGSIEVLADRIQAAKVSLG